MLNGGFFYEHWREVFITSSDVFILLYKRMQSSVQKN